MKSVERHKLDTNELAHGLEVYIDRSKPYIGKVLLGIGAFIALLFVWSFVSGSSSARQSEAWDSFNDAVGSQPINMEQLRQAAEGNSGTEMAEFANLTWADGQLLMASNAYIYGRPAANEALTKAASAYQGVIQSSSDPTLTGRARLGLARVYEMQNELDKAREQYGLVTGAFANYGKAQAERLAKPEAIETYAWLAKAQPPRPIAPMGPGTPGKGPAFSPGDISLPNAGQGTSGEGKNAAETFDDIIKKMQSDSKASEKPEEKTDERYKDQPPATDANPAVPPAAPGADAPPAEPKADEAPATPDVPATPPAADAPADDKSSK